MWGADGESFPRPSVEMIEKSWQLTETQIDRGSHTGIKIFMDPDLNYSTYGASMVRFE